MNLVRLLIFYIAIVNTIAFANPDKDLTVILAEADEIRTSDAQHSKDLLSSLTPSALTSEQKQLYDYLQAYNFSMYGNLQEAIHKLEQLQKEPLSTNIKLRSLSSLVIWYSAVKNWHKGMTTVDLLQSLFLEKLSDEAIDSAYLSLIIFYNQLEQYEQAIKIADKAIKSSHSPKAICKISSELLNAKLHLQPKLLTFNEFDTSMARCKAVDEKVQMHIVAAYKAEYLLKTEHPLQVLALLEQRISDVEKINFPQLTAGYYDLFLQVYQKFGDLDKAEMYAQLNLENSSKHQYKPAILNANKVLGEIAEQKNDYQLALQYFKNVLSEENSKFDQEFTKLLAVQNAKLNSIEKTNQIALLDKENALLKTQSELAKKNSENDRLFMALLSLVMVLIFLWAYKNRRMHKKLRKLAETDELTGIANRYHFSQLANAAISYCEKSRQPLSFILFDLDFFKKINDNFGHLVGDWALKQAVLAAQAVCRNNDVMGRLGGEEFGIILPGCAADKALLIAESCRQAIAGVDSAESGHAFKITASFGVADTSCCAYELDKLFAAADMALYQSKDLGRNRVYRYQNEQLTLAIQ